jgi:hypothetical protein
MPHPQTLRWDRVQRAALLALALAVLACSDNRTPYSPDGGSDDPLTFSCLPNLDGLLERSELPTQLRNAVPYLVAQNTNVDLSGNEIDLRSEIPGEEKLDLVALPLEGQWFENEFPADSIIVPLSGAGDTLGVLQQSESSLSLLGIVSTLEGHTLLHYQDPIDLYRFPIAVGRSWTSTSTVTDTYEVSVPSTHILLLPHLRFTSTYRVDTTVTSDSGAAGVIITRQQISLLSECFGEITRALSQDNESDPNFTAAAELWRFSL